MTRVFGSVSLTPLCVLRLRLSPRPSSCRRHRPCFCSPSAPWIWLDPVPPASLACSAFLSVFRKLAGGAQPRSDEGPASQRGCFTSGAVNVPAHHETGGTTLGASLSVPALTADLGCGQPDLPTHYGNPRLSFTG